MKLLPVLMIIILGIGSHQEPEPKTYNLTKEHIMLIYKQGYTEGYASCLKNTKMTKNGLTFPDTPTITQLRVIYSTEFENKYFK